METIGTILIAIGLFIFISFLLTLVISEDLFMEIFTKVFPIGVVFVLVGLFLIAVFSKPTTVYVTPSGQYISSDTIKIVRQ